MKNILVTHNEICELTGLTRQRLTQLADSGCFGKPRRGKWDLFATVAGLLTYYRDRLEVRRDTPETIAARQSKAESEAALAKLKLDEKSKLVLRKDAVEKIWADHVIRTREALRQLSLTPSALKRVLDEMAIAEEEYHGE